MDFAGSTPTPTPDQIGKEFMVKDGRLVVPCTLIQILENNQVRVSLLRSRGGWEQEARPIFDFAILVPYTDYLAGAPIPKKPRAKRQHASG